MACIDCFPATDTCGPVMMTPAQIVKLCNINELAEALTFKDYERYCDDTNNIILGIVDFETNTLTYVSPDATGALQPYTPVGAINTCSPDDEVNIVCDDTDNLIISIYNYQTRTFTYHTPDGTGGLTPYVPTGPVHNCSGASDVIEACVYDANGERVDTVHIDFGNTTPIVYMFGTKTVRIIQPTETLGNCDVSGNADVIANCDNVARQKLIYGDNLLVNGDFAVSTGTGAASLPGTGWTTQYAAANDIFAAGAGSYAFFTTNAGSVTGGFAAAVPFTALTTRSMAVNVGTNTALNIISWANVLLENGHHYVLSVDAGIINGPFGLGIYIDGVLIAPVTAPPVAGVWTTTETEFLWTGTTGLHTVTINSNTGVAAGNDHVLDNISLYKGFAANTETSTNRKYDDTVRAVIDQVVQTASCNDDRRDEILSDISKKLGNSDVETLVLCDDNGQFLRRTLYDKDGVFISLTNTALDGSTAYTPVGTVGLCASSTHIEQLVLCDDNGQFLRRTLYDKDGVFISLTNTTLDGSTAYTPVGTVELCTSNSDTELLTLCDDNGTFLRKILFDKDGVILSLTDTELDGITAYTVTGNVVLCDTDVENIVLCDDNGTFIRSTRYGSVTTINDYNLDGITPYVVSGTVKNCITASVLLERCYTLTENTVVTECTEDTQPRVLWENSGAWDGTNPTWPAVEAVLLTDTPTLFKNVQTSGIDTTLTLTGAISISPDVGATSLLMAVPDGTSSSLEFDFNVQTCAVYSIRVYANVPTTITSDAPVHAFHNTTNPLIQGDVPTITNNDTTSVTITSPTNSRVILEIPGTTTVTIGVANASGAQNDQFIGMHIGQMITSGGGTVTTYKVIDYTDGTQIIVNTEDPNDRPVAIDPAWTLVPCVATSSDDCTYTVIGEACYEIDPITIEPGLTAWTVDNATTAHKDIPNFGTITMRRIAGAHTVIDANTNPCRGANQANAIAIAGVGTSTFEFTFPKPVNPFVATVIDLDLIESFRSPSHGDADSLPAGVTQPGGVGTVYLPIGNETVADFTWTDKPFVPFTAQFTGACLQFDFKNLTIPSTGYGKLIVARKCNGDIVYYDSITGDEVIAPTIVDCVTPEETLICSNGVTILRKVLPTGEIIYKGDDGVIVAEPVSYSFGACGNCCDNVVGNGCWTGGRYVAMRSTSGVVTLYDTITGAVVNSGDVVTCATVELKTTINRMTAANFNVAAGAKSVTVLIIAGTTVTVSIGGAAAVPLPSGITLSWNASGNEEILTDTFNFIGGAGSDYIVTVIRDA